MKSVDKIDRTQDVKSTKPNKASCLKVLLIIGAICVPIILLAASGIFIYIASIENFSASATKTPSATQTIYEKTVSTQKTKIPAKRVDTQAASEIENLEPDSTSENQNSDQGIVDYFIDTAVYDASKREQFITRWNASNVSVGVGEGEFNESLNNCLASFISDFNLQSSSAKLVRNDTVGLGTPNIKIYYWDDAKFKQRAGNIEYGFTEWIHKDDKSLQRSMLFLSTKVMEMDEAVRCQVIRHEMMHAVGFWGHSGKYFESIMALPKTRYIYPDEDKQIVRMLYNTGINIGANASSARAFLQGKSW